MQIGSFKSINGNLFGSLATAEITLPRLGLKPVESDNEKAPAFQVMTLNPARRWVEIGALWRAVSNGTGEVFYQGQVDDPSFAQPLSVALFGNDEDGFNAVWNRRRRRRNDDFGDTAEGGEEAPVGSFEEPQQPSRSRRGRRNTSFEGNATADGKLVDDTIPF
jgi:uncharacterized protein (DUF736 family)